jgi:DNA modification methylase
METNRIICGDNCEVMRTMPSESIDCCVTSPPYFGLRDYGTAEWEGGDPGCDHREKEIRQRRNLAEAANACDGGSRTSEGRLDKDALWIPYKDKCGKCGAVRVDSQIGLEPTPDAYVAKLVAVFREVRRVLRDDGTLWLNLGDSYAGSWGNAGGHNRGNGKQRDITVGSVVKDQSDRNGDFVPPGARGFKELRIKPKDLIGIPWRVAFALQADGWYLRQDIIWHKPNPMPESVTDRCTKAHEYVFLLSKSARYYFDSEAIKEPCSEATHERAKYRWKRTQNGGGSKESMQGHNYDNDFGDMAVDLEKGKNKRSVWTITTKPYSGAHFAVMPADLVKPCIMAGCREGGVVLDPFSGSGTTAMVARDLSCRYVGIELNPKYVEISLKRLEQGVLF